MKITELGSKMVISNLWGEIGFIGEVEEKTRKVDGKKFHTQFIVLHNVEGKTTNPMDDSEIEIEDESIGINLIVHSDNNIATDMKGQTLSLVNLTINDYNEKRSLKAYIPKKAQKVVEEEKTQVIAKKEDILKNIEIKLDSLIDFIMLEKKSSPVPYTTGISSNPEGDKIEETEEPSPLEKIKKVAKEPEPRVRTEEEIEKEIEKEQSHIKHICFDCYDNGKTTHITEAECQYSQEHHGRKLCRNHQNIEREKKI